MDNTKISESTNLNKVKLDLIELVNQLIEASSSDAEFESIILWISNTNGYVSCYRYSDDEELIDEDGISFTLELPTLWESIINDESRSFYDVIIQSLNDLTSSDFRSNNYKSIYETWEINEPELLIELL